MARYPILVVLAHLQALYQWRCSKFDSVRQRFYFPDLGGQDKVSRKRWEPSTNDMGYIYPVNASDLTCQGGTVTDVEFCYTAMLNDVQNGNVGRVFTLLILSEYGERYNISEVVQVEGTPNTSICSSLGNELRCCEIMTLDLNSSFTIPPQNFAIGVIVPSSATAARSQGFFDRETMYAAPSQLVTLSTVRNLLIDGAYSNRGLRLFWLHITNPATTDAPSTAVSTIPPDDSITISTSYDASTELATNSTSNDIVNTNSQSNIAFQYKIAIGGVVGTFVALCAISAILALFVFFVLKCKRQTQYSIKRETEDSTWNTMTSSTNNNYERQRATEISSSNTMQSRMDHYYSYIGPNINHPLYDSALAGSYTEYDDIYVVPADDISGLYSQLDEMTRQNVCRENIRIGDCIGSGEFGNVYKGVWKRINDSINIAIKTLKHGSSENDTIKFLQEAAIMTQFKHPNVVNMYGVVKDIEPIMLVLEMLTKGDLRSYLLSMKTIQGEVIPSIDGHELLSYCRQVASGMAYLANKRFVHRDLAARNILVSDDGICKIADFGMSRDLMNESYYISHGGKIPVKWTAPEALFYKKYSTASDVWSFGIVIYEIWSIGKKPFENISNAEVIQVINSGYRLHPPPGCSYAVYDIMMSCWHPEASCRPDFINICTQLSVSNSKLLHWSPEDKSEYPEATKLGADISCSEKLYERIQSKYKNV